MIIRIDPEVVAEILAHVGPDDEWPIGHIARDLADYFEEDSFFDRARFLKAAETSY